MVTVILMMMMQFTSSATLLSASIGETDYDSEYGVENGADDSVSYDATHFQYGPDTADYDVIPSSDGGSEAYDDSATQTDNSDVGPSAKTSYSHPDVMKQKKKKVYVPVFVPEKQKKKMKIIAVDKGFYIPGGTQLFGRFLSLKKCMRACGDTPTCFSADYNPWLHKCYQHSNFTACNTRRSHPQFVHFSKVPCSIIDAPAGKVTLGASMSGGVLQKGLDTITECIKKCVSAGGGIQPTLSVGSVLASDAFARQACFAIDFDFSTHHCYFFGTNLWTVPFPTSTTGVTQTFGQIFFHCPITVTGYQSLNTVPNPNVVHITFCPLPVG